MVQFTVRNTGTFIQSPGHIVGNIIAGNTGLGFTLQLLELSQIPAPPEPAPRNITLTKMTGSLQCPNEMATLTFNTSNPINKTAYWIHLRHDIPARVSATDDFYCRGTTISNYP